MTLAVKPLFSTAAKPLLTMFRYHDVLQWEIMNDLIDHLKSKSGNFKPEGNHGDEQRRWTRSSFQA
jgi:hypothetical protein